MTKGLVLLVVVATVIVLCLVVGVCCGLALMNNGWPWSGSTLALGCGGLLSALCCPLGEEDDHDGIY